MNDSTNEQISEINREDFIWGIYIFIVAFALLSNQLEKEYVYTHDEKKHQDFHNINTVLLGIGVLIYIYFFLNASYKFQKNRNKNSYLTVVATTLFLVGSVILFWLEYQGSDEPDIPF